MAAKKRHDVLVLGVFLQNTANYALEISAELRRSRDWSVDLRWAALGSAELPRDIAEATQIHTTERIPKFKLLNRLLRGVDLGRYRYLVVVDDDVELGDRFLDSFLALQQRHRLALAQPARTHDSFIDHFFVAQLHGVAARRTRFVEIGPVFSIAADAFSRLLPFDETAPMGWGLDFVWPAQLAEDAMNEFLQSRQYLKPDEAFVTLESYPILRLEKRPVA